MDFSVYEPFLKNNGTPIRCCSQAEVDQFVEDMCSFYPGYERSIRSMGAVFGHDDSLNGEEYITEIVFRFREKSDGEIEPNFCTYDYYRRYGYEIVDFAEILAVNGDGVEDVSSDLQEDWSSLFQ